MKKALSLLLCIVMVMTPVMATASAADPSPYYPAYTAGNYPSLESALACVGACNDCIYQIAAANNIGCYTGTAAQKHTMLSLLMVGRLRRAGTTYVAPTKQAGCFAPYLGAPTTSLVDAMKSMCLVSTFNTRKAIAAYNGMCNYTGSNAQNARMLGLLMSGMLKTPPKPACPTPVCPPVNCPPVNG